MLMSVKREIAITCEFCCDLHLTLRVFWSKQMIPLKEREVIGKKLFHTKLWSCLAHKVYRLCSSPIWLHKFTNKN